VYDENSPFACPAHVTQIVLEQVACRWSRCDGRSVAYVSVLRQYDCPVLPYYVLYKLHMTRWDVE